MTSGKQPDPSVGELRQEAANWWAAMHGPTADEQRHDFEDWLDQGSDHRAAYNRMGELHALGKHLKGDPELADGNASPIPPRTSRKKYVLPLAAAALALLVGTWSYRQATIQRLLPPVQDDTANAIPFERVATGTLATRIGEIRRVSLSDGSWIILDTDSRVFVSLSADNRVLRLDRGRARVAIRSGSRPLRLVVGDISIVASHAILDADRTKHGKTAIHIIDGNATIADHSATSTPPIALASGQSVSIEPGASAPKAETEAASAWPTGAIDVDNMALSDLAAEANRYSTAQIVLGSPDLAALKVSGRFRINGTAILARRLALLFDLRVEQGPDGRIRLARM